MDNVDCRPNTDPAFLRQRAEALRSRELRSLFLACRAVAARHLSARQFGLAPGKKHMLGADGLAARTERSDLPT